MLGLSRLLKGSQIRAKISPHLVVNTLLSRKFRSLDLKLDEWASSGLSLARGLVLTRDHSIMMRSHTSFVSLSSADSLPV